MDIRNLCLSLYLGVTGGAASDYLTIKQQKAIINNELSKESSLLKEASREATVNNTEEPSEVLRQLYPAVPNVPAQPIIVQQTAQRLHTILELNDTPTILSAAALREMQHQAAQTMFHSLNDSLSFLLTSKNLVNSALIKNPMLSQLIHPSLRLQESLLGNMLLERVGVDFHHPLTYLTQRLFVLREFQWWIDFITTLKKNVFPDYSVSSYRHNDAVEIKAILRQQIQTLEEKVNAYPVNLQFQKESLNDEEVIFANTFRNFYHDLLHSFKKIHEILPDATINYASSRSRNIAKKIQNAEARKGNALKHLPVTIHTLQAYYSKSLPAILDAIYRKATLDLLQHNLPANYLKIFHDHHAQPEQIKTALQMSYQRLIQGIVNNIEKVKDIRKNLKLKTQIFNGLNLESELYNAYQSYTEQHRARLLEQKVKRVKEKDKAIEILGTNDSEEIDHNLQKAENKPLSLEQHQTNISQAPKQISENEAEAEYDPEAEETIDSSFRRDRQVPDHAETEASLFDEEEEDLTFDGEYFRSLHEYHQTRKKQQGNQGSKEQPKISGYVIDLCRFLKENIYQPKHRSSWSQLTSALSHLGFQGKPNTFGNGSTWKFSINNRNSLFSDNPDYKNATFNVHEYKGNGPIHPAYLKFFKSGLSNVFGLTEAYISKVLEAEDSKA